MSFYGTPLKHGKGVNKPFRSPLIKTDPNQDRSRGDGTPNSRRLQNTSSKITQNSRVKSLGFKSPMNAKGFISPLKPLKVDSPSKKLEEVSESLGFASPLKRLEYESPLKSSETKTSVKFIEKTSLKASKNVSPQPSGNNALKSLENNSPSKVEDTHSPTKGENSSPSFSSREKSLKSKVRSPTNDLISKTEEHKSPLKSVYLNTPPLSPMILRTTQSPEYQPVVKLQRLSSELQNISKQDLAILVKRINDKQRQMVELRAQMPTNSKRKLQEIRASIIKWREVFVEAIETLRVSLAEKNGRPFSTSDVLKLLAIPNSIVNFSEMENDFIFPKL